MGQIVGVGTVAGIGFTVSLFITELAFDDPALIADAKLAVLVASVAAAALGTALLWLAAHERAPMSGPAGGSPVPAGTATYDRTNVADLQPPARV
jgi:hypothetical protein